MTTLFGSGSSTNTSNTLGDLSGDVALTSPPEDSVSDINFSTQTSHLAVASWDKKVRIYEINQTGGSSGVAAFEHEAPVLSCHWSPVSFLITLALQPANMFAGWQESCGSRSRQSCAYDGHEYHTNNSSRRSRSTYSSGSILHPSCRRRSYACYRIVGQDYKILGSKAAKPCGYSSVSGESLYS
jgi:WD40 repeat protein